MDFQIVSLPNLEIKLQQHPEVWSPLGAPEMLEVLIAKGELQNLEGAHVLDFGTGSGILGIACGLLGAQAITLSDYCPTAVAIALQNARFNGLTRVTGVQSDRFTGLKHQRYDLIISNPPVQPWLYTDLADREHRARVEAWNEAGADGRLVLDSLLCNAQAHLQPGGRLITSTSSRHGWTKTQHLLDAYWPGRWRELYHAEQLLLPDYHGPYLQSWLEMQTHDLDLRVYQKDDQGRSFAVYTNPQGETCLLATADGSHYSPLVCWQQREGRWQPTSTVPPSIPSSRNTQPRLSLVEMKQLMDADKSEEIWHSTFHIVEANKQKRD